MQLSAAYVRVCPSRMRGASISEEGDLLVNLLRAGDGAVGVAADGLRDVVADGDVVLGGRGKLDLGHVFRLR